MVATRRVQRFTSRRNPLYDFDEHATTVEARFGRNWSRGLRTGVTADVLAIDTGIVRPVAVGGRHRRHSDGRRVCHGRHARFVHESAPRDVGRGSRSIGSLETRARGRSSWTAGDSSRCRRVMVWGCSRSRRFRPVRSGVSLPEYLQFALGGANSVRGWDVGSRHGRNQFIGTVEYIVRREAGDAVFGGWRQPVRRAAGRRIRRRRPGVERRPRTSIPARRSTATASGLRLLVPFVDVIRLDVAWGEPGRGAFGYFGVSLKAARQRQRVR